MPDRPQLLEQYANLRPGFELIDADDVAIPVAYVTVDLLVQERKRVPLLEEFLLRLVREDVNTPAEVAAFLGIDSPLVTDALANQLTADNVDYRLGRDGSTRVVTLTPMGQRAVTDLVSITPKREQLPWCFDLLTWQPTPHKRRDLLTRSDAREAGMRVLPALRTGDVSVDDFPARLLNRLLSQDPEKESRIEVIGVQGIVKQPRLFLPATMLVFQAARQDDVQLAIVLEGQLSRSHELRLQELGGAAALGVRVEPPAPPPPLPPDLQHQRADRGTVAELRRTVIGVEPSLASPQPDRAPAAEQRQAAEEAQKALAALPVRSVSVFEHRELLEEALTTAQRRMLIISPWVKGAVVDTTFLGRLERLLRRGVAVTLAHGIGPDDRDSDRRALERLANLTRRYERFEFIRLKNSHAKVLIFDDNWINSSFNWLSFKGDPSRTYRMEEGTLVQIPDIVEAEYAKYLEAVRRDKL